MTIEIETVSGKYKVGGRPIGSSDDQLRRFAPDLFHAMNQPNEGETPLDQLNGMVRKAKAILCFFNPGVAADDIIVDEYDFARIFEIWSGNYEGHKKKA